MDNIQVNDKRFTVISFDKPANFNNGNINGTASYYVTMEFLTSYRDIKRVNTSMAAETLQFFIANDFIRFNSILLDCLYYLVRKYNGYPSTSICTKEFMIVFTPVPKNTAFIECNENYTRIMIGIDANAAVFEDNVLRSILLHELLHPISQVNYGERKISNLIRRWNKHLQSSIQQNGKILEVSINEFLKNLKSEDLISAAQEFDRLIHRFYARAFVNFDVNVADTALGIIAIELGDDDYNLAMLRGDEAALKPLETHLKNLKSIFNGLMKPSPNQKYFNSAYKLLQYMYCYDSMPYRAIAWGVLSENKRWVAGHPYSRLSRDNSSIKVVAIFKKIVKGYCEHDVAQYFLEFYDAYLHIVNLGAIHNDPLNPNIRKQIFDTECIKQASNAYKILNKNFYILIQEVARNRTSE